MKTRPTINIQDEVSKIHAQYGITEMANYRIEKLFEKHVEQFSPKVKQLEWVEDVLFSDMIVSDGFSLLFYRINIIDNTLYMGDTAQSFNTIYEAKAAAQDDFERRVRECLDLKAQQKQALIDMMRGDEEIGLYDDNSKNHGYER